MRNDHPHGLQRKGTNGCVRNIRVVTRQRLIAVISTHATLVVIYRTSHTGTDYISGGDVGRDSGGNATDIVFSDSAFRTRAWIISCSLGTSASFARLPRREVVFRSSVNDLGRLRDIVGAGDVGEGGVIVACTGGQLGRGNVSALTREENSERDMDNDTGSRAKYGAG